jgi:hypothetical protein
MTFDQSYLSYPVYTAYSHFEGTTTYETLPTAT